MSNSLKFMIGIVAALVVAFAYISGYHQAQQVAIQAQGRCYDSIPWFQLAPFYADDFANYNPSTTPSAQDVYTRGALAGQAIACGQVQ